jgi:selenide,water dikinase
MKMEEKYRLTKSVSLHGCSCKLPRHRLEELLDEARITIKPGKELLSGPWEDAGVYKISEDVALVENLDFFTPIVDEPEIQGKIAACNVTNDVYVMAPTRILYALAIMGIPPDMPRDVAVGMLKGFSDFLSGLGVKVIGGQTTLNPWPIMGGCAVGIGDPKKIVYSKGAKPGDLLVLTKPLGIQPAMAAYRLRKEENGRKYLRGVPEELVGEAIAKAIEIMTTSNRPVAEAMHQVKVNAATDITGFGLMGHATNIARLSHVNIEITKLPVIKGTSTLSKLLGYPLLTGEASETAGGVLISVSKHNVDKLLETLEEKGVMAFVIGNVRHGSGDIILAKNLEIYEM